MCVYIYIYIYIYASLPARAPKTTVLDISSEARTHESYVNRIEEYK